VEEQEAAHRAGDVAYAGMEPGTSTPMTRFTHRRSKLVTERT
jgi:hypothetical protein